MPEFKPATLVGRSRRGKKCKDGDEVVSGLPDGDSPAAVLPVVRVESLGLTWMAVEDIVLLGEPERAESSGLTEEVTNSSFDADNESCMSWGLSCAFLSDSAVSSIVWIVCRERSRLGVPIKSPAGLVCFGSESEAFSDAISTVLKTSPIEPLDKESCLRKLEVVRD